MSGGAPAGLRAVTFDFGNTLVPVRHEDLRRTVAVTVERVLGEHAPTERAAFLVAWAEERDRQFAEEVPAFREVDIAQRFVRVFARTRGMAVPAIGERWDDEAAARHSDEAEVAAAVDAYIESFVASLPVPAGVGEMLELLAGRFRLGILSNWPVARAIDRYAAEAGWAPWLTAIVVSQRVGTIKPHPAIFRAAEEALGISAPAEPAERSPAAPAERTPAEPAAPAERTPGQILHVGDDWAADIVGAKRAGWRAAYLRRRTDSPLPSSERDDSVEADLEIEELLDLPGLLAGAAR